MTELAEQRLAALKDGPLPLDDPRFLAGLKAVVSFSEYGFDVARRHAEAIAVDWDAGRFDQSLERTPVRIDLEAAGGDETRALAALRNARHRALFRILWRDVNALAGIDQILAEQTLLAEGLIDAALALAKSQLTGFGSPRGPDGEPQELVVFGLGKVGGRELNFSSDVDLVYAYAHAGETDGRRKISAEQYFIKLASGLTRLLSRPTEDGFCYRVDLRLRPFGDAGRLALSGGAMEQYFQREGREWERYAWIKARSIAGDQSVGDSILRMLRPFVYRRYLDFGAFESLREMKVKIRTEVERRELVDHIKLGRGGIREIEFIAQAFQLIRGGREPLLRKRSLLPTIAALAELGELGPDDARALSEAYRFMRRLENRFQQVRDEQTHQPPSDERVRSAIASSLDVGDWRALGRLWQRHRDYVSPAFDRVFADPESSGPELDRWKKLWFDPDGSDEPAAEVVERFQRSAALRSLGMRSRKNLDRLIPQVLADLGPGKDTTNLERILEVIATVARRSTYLALLAEHDDVRAHLIRLCAASPWLADKLSGHPLMLDELIDRRPTDAARTPAAHVQRRLETAQADLELEMEILREVRDSRRIGLAAAFLDGQRSVEDVAHALAEVADALLQAVYDLAWRDLTARHGQPSGQDPGLAIVGYGTLGGRELSIESDLDLVFLYDGSEDGGTDGKRPVSNAQFFTRLSQRILHLLTTQTASGRLFEVDTRLRPNGRAGLLVSSLAAFETYQKEQAWTWELQALTRARWVAGAAALREPFDAVRRSVIRRSREAAALREQVVEMRAKMRTELDRSRPGWFDLKQGRGGRVDLEFLTQYARLRWAAQHPELATPRGTLETLMLLEKLALIDAGRADQLGAAYHALQHRSMQTALANEPAVVEDSELKAERAAIEGLWQGWL